MSQPIKGSLAELAHNRHTKKEEGKGEMHIGFTPVYDPKNPFNSATAVARQSYLEVIMRHRPGLRERIEQFTNLLPWVEENPVVVANPLGTPIEIPLSRPDFTQLDELFVSLNLPDDGKRNLWFSEAVWAYWKGFIREENGTRSIKLETGDMSDGPKVAFALTQEELTELQKVLDEYKPNQADHKADVKEQALKVMGKSFKRYFADVEVAYNLAGYKKTIKKKPPDPLKHFEWFYLVHVQGLTQKEAANETGVDENNFSRVVSPLRKLILGAELPPPPPYPFEAD